MVNDQAFVEFRDRAAVDDLGHLRTVRMTWIVAGEIDHVRVRLLRYIPSEAQCRDEDSSLHLSPCIHVGDVPHDEVGRPHVDVVTVSPQSAQVWAMIYRFA